MPSEADGHLNDPVHEHRGPHYWQSKVSRLIIKHQGEDPDVLSKKKEFRLREHDNMFWKLETHLIMHDLAYEYFWQRAFVLNLAILTLGVAIAIIGVIESVPTGVTQDENGTVTLTSLVEQTISTESTDDGLDDLGDVDIDISNSTGRFLAEISAKVVSERTINPTQVIAILGISITFLKSFEKYFNYQSRSDLHESAVTTLKDICDELFTTRLDVDLMCDECEDENKDFFMDDKDGNPKKKPDEDDFNVKREKTKMSKAKFDTMQKACTDPIPPQISDEFIELQEVLKFASYDLNYYFLRRYYHKIAQRMRHSVIGVTPPFCLMGFKTDDIYKELYEDCYYFFLQTAHNAVEKDKSDKKDKSSSTATVPDVENGDLQADTTMDGTADVV